MKTIITGYFGSGKTEIAMQLARDKKKAGHGVTLVDLDVVNPYFTSSAHRESLQRDGIKVVSPGFANTNVDAPLLTGGIHAALLDRQSEVIIDLGGDATGATVMGSLVAAIKPQDAFNFLLAVNVFRPFTQSVEEIVDLMQTLQAHARLPITGFINNTNLLEQTEPGNLAYGETILQQAARRTGKPIAYHSGTAYNISQNSGRLAGEPIVLKPNRPQWI